MPDNALRLTRRHSRRARTSARACFGGEQEGTSAADVAALSDARSEVNKGA